MLRSAPSRIDRARCLAGLFAAATAALCAWSCDPESSAPATAVTGDSAYIVIDGTVPPVIYADTLVLEGKARSGDTVTANLYVSKATALSADGRFRLRLAVPRFDSSDLRLYARGKDGSRSGTLRIPVSAPGLVDEGIPPGPTNKDTARFQLRAPGFDSIRVTVNGETRGQPVRDGYVSGRAVLRPNAMNRISVRGVREGAVAGDSLVYLVPHDNIAPRLVSSDFNYRNKDYRVDTTVTLSYDDSLPWFSVTVDHIGYSTDITFETGPDRKRFFLKFSMAAGDSALLHLKGSDRAGNLIDSLLPVKSYLRKLSLPSNYAGQYRSFRPGILYMAMQGLTGLIAVDTERLSIKDTVPLPAGDNKIVINPYNQRIYVAIPATQSLAVLDPLSKAVVRTIPLPVKFFQKHDLSLAFHSGGVGLLSFGTNPAIYQVDSRNGDSLSEAGLFPKEIGIIQNGYRSLDSGRAILISRGWGTLAYYVLRNGDTAVTPIPLHATDRSITILEVSPDRDILALSDRRLIDSRGTTVGHHLFDSRDGMYFGVDAKGGDYLLRGADGGLQIDRFRTTGLAFARVRGSAPTLLAGTDRFLVEYGKDFHELGLGIFGP